METEEKIINEAINRLIKRYREDYKEILWKLRREIQRNGGILK